MAARKIAINRAPVLTLWAAVVAARSGHDEQMSLTLGQALAALNAQSKGRRLGIYETPAEDKEATRKKSAASAASIRLLGREIPVMKTARGLRAGRRAHSPRGRTGIPGEEVRRRSCGGAPGDGGIGRLFDARTVGNPGVCSLREVPPPDPRGQERLGRQGRIRPRPDSSPRPVIRLRISSSRAYDPACSFPNPRSDA
jgi:hypothetical protein